MERERVERCALWRAFGLARAGLVALLDATLDAVYPEQCLSCGGGLDPGKWCERGALVPGLNVLDRPHLCRPCLADLFPPDSSVRRWLPREGRALPVHGATATGEQLTRVVGEWKYGGVRGLAWPLAGALAASLASGGLDVMRECVLVPVPLHRRRERARGFNQALGLAALVSAQLGVPWRRDLARRVRRTGQQARIQCWDSRARNLAGAFAGRKPQGDEGRQLVLVDDIITSGATVLALATALEEAGWTVRACLALGVARPRPGEENGGAVDRPEPPF